MNINNFKLYNMKKLVLLTLCLALGTINTLAGVFEGNLWLAKSYHCSRFTAPPADNWYAEDFDDSGWSVIQGPLASFTEYETYWFRLKMNLSVEPSEVGNVFLEIYHDDGAQVYVNGNLAYDYGDVGNPNNAWITSDFFHKGTNVIAFRVSDTGGGQFADIRLTADYNGQNALTMAGDYDPCLIVSKESAIIYAVDNDKFNQYTPSVFTYSSKGVNKDTYTFVSSNPEIAQVVNGKIYAVSGGKATITASATLDGGVYTDEFEINVVEFEAGKRVAIVDQPGTLRNQFTTQELDEITELVVVGTLNAEDVITLRYMAGRDNEGKMSDGQLSVLDLTGAKFNGEGGSFKVDNNYTCGVNQDMPERMFANCNSLTKVILPASQKYVPYWAFSNCKFLSEVVIPEGYTSIESGAFVDCASLSNITIPSTITRIESEAFRGASRLSGVVFTENSQLSKIATWAFGDSGLTSFLLPASVTTLEGSAFYRCQKLREFVIEENSLLKEIPEYCFGECYKLSTFTIPEDSKLVTIGGWAFGGCPLTSFYAPKGLKSMANVGFNRDMMKSFVIHPDNTYLQNIDGIIYGRLDQNVIFISKDLPALICIPEFIKGISSEMFANLNGVKTIILPNTVSYIENRAFCGSWDLRTIISTNTKAPLLDDNSFGEISKDNITLYVPESAIDTYRSKGWNVFAEIKALSQEPDITLNKAEVSLVLDVNHREQTVQLSYNIINQDGIYNGPVTWSSNNTDVATVDANGLVTATADGEAIITLTVNLGGVDYSATCKVKVKDLTVNVEEGTLMVNVETPGTLNTLISEADRMSTKSLFVMGALNSSDIRILRYMAGRNEYGALTPGSLEHLDMSAAHIVDGGDCYLDKGNGWTIWASSNCVGSYMFEKCNSLKYIALPTDIAVIYECAFDQCKNLEEVVLPNSLHELSWNVFSNCTKLKTINFPSSLERIGSCCFMNCNALETVDLSACKNLQKIESNAFQNTSVREVSLPENLQEVGSYAFAGTKLSSVVIPDKVVRISDWAFAADSLNNVVISDKSSLTSLDGGAFASTRIKSLYLPKTLLEYRDINMPETFEAFVVDPSHKRLHYENGVLYSEYLGEEQEMLYIPRAYSGILQIPDFVSEIDREIVNHRNITTLIIPASVTRISPTFVEECPNLVNVFCQATTPPTEDQWGYFNQADGKILYVPNSSVEAYRQTSWNNFQKIIGVSDEPVMTLSATEIELANVEELGQSSCQLTATTLSLAGFSEAEVTWSSSNQDVATVSANGVVSIGILEGSATITAAAVIDGKDVTAQCNVISKIYVKEENGVVIGSDGTELAFVPEEITSLTIPAGIKTISADLQRCTNLAVVVTYADEAPSYSGEFNNVSAITLLVPKGKKDVYANATPWNQIGAIYEVGDQPRIILDASDIVLYDVKTMEMRQKQIKAIVISNQGVLNATVEWTTSDPQVATVQNGLVEVAGSGDAVITAACTIGDFTATATCNVSAFASDSGNKIIYVAQAGTLADMLTADEIANQKSLVVMGELNGYDLRTLRYMAGRDTLGVMTGEGLLENLDLRKTRIVEGGGYLYKDGWWRGTGWDNLGESAFEGCTQLKKIVLPESLTGISNYSFKDCRNLQEVVMSDNVCYIESYAFENCYELAKVKFSTGLERISGCAFVRNKKLAQIDLSMCTRLDCIEWDAFNESGLANMKLPEGLHRIGGNAFRSTKLTSIIMPATVNTIEWDAFAESPIMEIEIPDESMLTNVSGSAFRDTKVKELFIPRRLIDWTDINLPGTFERFIVDPAHKTLSFQDGVLYYTNFDTPQIRYIAPGVVTLRLPEGYDNYNDGWSIASHHSLETLILDKTTEKVGHYVFYDNESLRTVIVPCIVPPMVEGNWFDTYNCNTNVVNVIVPEASVAEYKNSVWGNYFRNIVGVGDEPQVKLSSNLISLVRLADGESDAKLTATIISMNGLVSNPVITWTSEDTNVATVDANGKVSVAGMGETYIVASTIIDGTTYSAKCHVKILDLSSDKDAYFVEAGRLSEIIPESKKYEITTLKLYGQINSNDVRYLRQMAGVDGWSDTDGKLAILDISNVNVVEGGDGYDTRCAGWQYNSTNLFGNDAFSNCRSLEEIYLPEGLKRVSDGLLRDCQKLRKVQLPASTSAIGGWTFYNSPQLKDINLPTEFNYIGDEAFGGSAMAMDSIVIARVDSIGDNALTGLSVVHMSGGVPAKLNRVGSRIVNSDAIIIVPATLLDTYRQNEQWSVFAEQIIPDNVSLMAEVTVTARDGDSGLLLALGSDAASYVKNLTVHGTINSWDIIFIRNKMPLLNYLDLRDTRIVANPHEYWTDCHTEDDRLGHNMFRELKNLREVKLPNVLKYIGNAVFFNCENLRRIEVPAGVNTIDDSAFSNCGKLTEVILPEGLLSVGSYAFSNTRIVSIDLPSTLLAIGGSAFENCTELKAIVLPDMLRRIEWSTFCYCYNLAQVTLPSRLNYISCNAFCACYSLKELRIPPMVEYIEDYAFQSCDNLKDVYVYIANANDIDINMNTFSCWKTATLHVPTFSYSLYYWNTQWSQFYKLEEFSDSYDAFYTKNDLVLDNATGNIDGTPDATVYENGALVVNEDVVQEVDNIDLVSDGNGNAGSVIPETDDNIVAQNATISINVTGNQWHFFCFPFDIDLASVEYDGEYVWRQYDGAARSRREGGWQNLKSNENKLHAGRGYIFQGTNTGVLKMTVKNPKWTASDKNTQLESYPSSNASDASWNFIGNPYTSYYNIDQLAYDAPITVWTGNGYEAYRPGDDDYAFAPYTAFFVQTPDDSNAVGFKAEGRETKNESEETVRKAKARRARARINTERMLVNLTISDPVAEEDVYIDKTRIVFNDKKSLSYEINCDAAKFFSAERAIEIYTLDHEGNKYSINERPLSDGQIVLGISCNKSGTYVLSAPRMDKTVYLLDTESGETSSLSDGCEISVNEGEFTSRYVIVTEEAVTAIAEMAAEDADSEPAYDLSGRRVKAGTYHGVTIQKGHKVLK